MAKIRKQDALDYHSSGRPGKIQVIPTKPYASQRDLSLAYSPGVAEPCIRIAENADDVYKYTSKGNLVAPPIQLKLGSVNVADCINGIEPVQL